MRNQSDWGTPLLAHNSQYHGQPILLSEVGGLMMHPNHLPRERQELVEQSHRRFLSR